MADTFSNDLRLRLQESGSNAGTWGDLLNGTITNIASALGKGSEAIPNASTHTITLADGTADEARSLYLKCTGGGQACTVTLGPNTISKVWIIENETSYTLTFRQGSGTNVAIASGAVKVIATDGAGSGAAVVDTLDGLEGSLQTLAVNSGATTDTTAATIGYNGDAGTNLYINTDHGNNLVSLYASGSASKEMRFLSGTLEVMRLGTTGNVGINTSSPATQLFVKSAANAANVFAIESADAAQRLQFGVNTSNGGSYIFEQKAQALRFGTSDTERMRIDGASGNLGVGTSSPARVLEVASGDAAIVRITATDTTPGYAVTEYLNGNGGYAYAGSEGSSPGQLFIGSTASATLLGNTFAAPIQFATNNNVRATIDSSGKLIVTGTVAGYSGTNITVGSPSQATAGLSILSTTTGYGYVLFGDVTGDATGGYSGQINYAHSTDRMGFVTNNTERLAIYGTGQIEATSSVNDDYGFEIKNTSSTNPYGLQIELANGTSNTTQALIVAASGGNNKFIVWTNGNAQNVNNSYTGLSDLKLKENIVDSGSQWDDLKAVRVRKYSLKDANLDAPNMLGVIAQELEEAGMSGLVDEHPDKDDENNDLGTVTKSVSYSILYMKAIKALQEAMERIETLEAKVQELENN